MHARESGVFLNRLIFGTYSGLSLKKLYIFTASSYTIHCCDIHNLENNVEKLSVKAAADFYSESMTMYVKAMFCKRFIVRRHHIIFVIQTNRCTFWERCFIIKVTCTNTWGMCNEIKKNYDNTSYLLKGIMFFFYKTYTICCQIYNIRK